MESIVFEDSPLAAYLEGDGGEDDALVSSPEEESSSAPKAPSFAPRGKPTARLRLRHKLSPSLRINLPQSHAVDTIHRTCSRALNSRLGRADNERFLERFRYIIVASQLLSTHSYYSQSGNDKPQNTLSTDLPHYTAITFQGAAVTSSSAFLLAWFIHLMRSGKNGIGKRRVALFLIAICLLGAFMRAYTRRQWLQYLRYQALAEATDFVSTTQDLDSVVASALTLVQEVELVSRGYRLSTPLPPISRLEDNSQLKRCKRLRKTLRLCFADVIPRYLHAFMALKPLAESMDLEKYYDVYDISDLDYSESMLGYSEEEFEDPDSLRVLKILAARFHIARKLFLCSLLALDACGGQHDFMCWNTAVEEIQEASATTEKAEEQLRRILNEEESFPIPATPKMPLSPNRERWRAQLRKLNTLSSGIRGLQAKLHLMREESDKNLNDTEDVSELGASLMVQYESLGMDLKALMQEWEDGKAALATNIDRNERRISSMSELLSPTISLSGLTAVDEGNPSDALKALNGEEMSRSSMELSSSDTEEVFEAIALPRQRPLSTLTREERISKMKEDRAKRASIQIKAEANTRMLRELESVISLRPKNKTGHKARVTSI